MHSRVSEYILNLLYPPVCPFCGGIYKGGVCPECRKKLTVITEPRCIHCGKPLDREEQEYCADCRKKDSYITQGRALWVHSDPVPRAVYRFKYHNRRGYGVVFAREMAGHYEEWIRKCKIDLIVPVPLHPSKKRKRGFNQAEILAKTLSEETGIPVRTDVLFRIRKTKPQKELGPSERKANLKGAFAVSASWKAAGNVLLVDDIYTTGSTAERCAYMLKRAGVQNVWFLTISIGQGI